MYSLPALRYAAVAARLKSFSAAARECGVSQPTVSSAISDLEAALGAPLFLRGGRQLELSPAGDRLLPKIREVLAAIDALQATTVELATTARSELRIGFTPLAGAGRVAVLLDPYQRQHAETRMLFFESGVADLEHRLDAGQLDIIIGCGFQRSRTRKRLRLLQDPLVVCSPSLLASSGGGITLQAVSQQRLLLTQDLCGLATATGALFAAAGLPVDAYAGRAMSYGALEDWAELGLGCAVVPLVHVRNRARSRPLTDADGEPLSLPLEAVWKPRLASADHAARFLTYLHRVVPSLASGLVA
jgi:DNA-binding transcriptional LysR family regulator